MLCDVCVRGTCRGALSKKELESMRWEESVCDVLRGQGCSSRHKFTSLTRQAISYRNDGPQ